jgi:hypothetical protein
MDLIFWISEKHVRQSLWIIASYRHTDVLTDGRADDKL